MQISLTGLQSSGKSTLFTALTGKEPAIGETVHPGIALVPDPILDQLHQMWPMAKKVPARVEYLDVAALSTEDDRGGIKRSLVNHLQGSNVIALIVGIYHLPDSPIDELIQKVRDEVTDLEAEFLLSDLQIAENRRDRLEANRKRGLKAEYDPREVSLIEQIIEHLNNEVPLRDISLNEKELKLLRSYAFLTLKPMMIIVNRYESQDGDGLLEALKDLGNGDQRALHVIDARLEAEIAQLPVEDQAEFLEDLGIKQPASNLVIRSGFELLGLCRFFTVGEDEVRAWPIPRGTVAVDAAGEIHTDLQRGFIRAEVVRTSDLLELGSMSACRDKGLLRLEGKSYVVQDGDVMHVRFAV